MADFKGLVDSVKSKIENYASHSFHHIPRSDWLGTDKFKAAYAGSAYSVLLQDFDEGDSVSAAHNDATVNIQFALDATHDNYLDQLNYCKEALLQVRQVSGSYSVKDKVYPYFNCEVVDDYMRVEFLNTIFLIEDNE